ncbi:uncharacterized protein [Littorina saxatilis]|uniref:uncharacterized protein n=1 Tax=Littorina saxatilis TaxID=31220 RepID=UPI0038B4F5DF
MGSATKLGTLLLITFCLSAVESQGIQPLACPQGITTQSGTTRDWSLLYARCYLAISEAHVTWEEASKICQRYGGKLVEPSGFKLTEEVGAIATAFDPALSQVWIGYNRRGLTGDMTQGRWSDSGSTVADVGVWGYQQPDIGAGDCSYMTRGSGSTWTWYLGNCDLDLPFVCQATPCTDSTFRCDNGRCVGQSNVCNGENNCGDDSDERQCPAKCSYYLTEKQGSLTYPSSSGNYLPTQTCQWVIEGAIGTRIQIQFVSLKTERDVDFVELWAGGKTLSTSTLMTRLSGGAASGVFVSSNNYAVVRFLSDGSYQDSGFQLTWQSEFQCSMVEVAGQSAEDGEVASNSRQLDATNCGVQCSSDAQCVAYVYDSFTGQCRRYSSMPTTKVAACCTLYVKTCPGYSTMPSLQTVPGEGGDLYATSTPQRFHSTLYPIYYLGDTVMQWLIHAPGRQIVTLHILDLDLAAGDIIQVFDGSTSQASSLASMTGSDVSAVAMVTADNQRMLLSTASSLLVQFTSYHASTSRGFLFAYQAGCQFDLSANTGRVVSPGYQTNLYPNILQCDYTIQVQAGRTLTVTFDPGFSFEFGKDFLQVTADGSAVHTGSGFTGSTAPASFIAQNGRAELSMVTGATGRAVGFSATFNAGCSPIVDSTLATTYTANYSQSIVMQCASEYVFTGIYVGQNSVGLRCGAGGIWSQDTLPTCKRVFCGPPSDITNGYLVSVSGPYSGDTATYACKSGFQLSFSTPVKCRNTGSWDSPPFCSSVQSCPSVQDPFQGRYLVTAGNGFDHGSVINFTCTNSLYELRGSANLLCENGQWSGSVPTCARVPCPVPYVANGTVSPSVNVVDEQTLRVDCRPGFTLTGSAIFNCGQSSPPTCVNVDECQSVSGCSQGCVDTVGSFYCTCGAGYQLLSDQRTCADLDECSLNNGGCDGICINSPGTYRCDCVGIAQLYTANGQFGITIPPGETGLEPWNVYYLNHTCIQTPTVECPAPPQSISNGHMLRETGTFTVGRSVTYLCDLGYTAQGQTTLTCQSNGNWSSAVPVCVVATCQVPVVALGTVSPQTPVQYLDYVTVSCNLLGVVAQQLTSRCMWDKATLSYRVDTNLLRCDITGVDCDIPVRLPGSLPYSLSSSSYSAQFTFTCRAPLFTRVGRSGINNNEVVTCGADGVWDFGDLRCEGPTCPDPGTFAGTQQVATSYEEFSYVSYTCERTGFSPMSNLPLYCQYDPNTGGLAWNGTAQNCTDTSPPSFANCSSVAREVTYLSSAFFAEPIATDNVMVSDLTITPNDYRVSDVVQTDLQVSYIARDHVGNIGSCVVNIRVRDQSPPQIRCRSSFEEQLFTENQRAIYDPLNFVLSQAENTGIVDLSYSVNPLIIDRYSIGNTYTVKIDAADPTGNEDVCLVQVKVTAPQCVPWSLNVDNGNVTCFQQAAGGYRCDASCNTGYKFFENPDTDTISISCTPGNDWDRATPVCTSVYYTNYRLSFQMEYRTRNSPSLTCQSNYIAQINSQMPTLTAALSSLCTGLPVPVTVTSAANINAVAVTAYSDGVYATIGLDVVSSPSSGSAISQCVSSVTSAFTSVSSSLQSIRTLTAQNNCAASEVVRYRSILQDSVNCQNNQESRIEPATGRYQCVSCIPGYTSAIGSKCSACSMGSYFDANTGSCQFCPSGTRSQQLAARTIDDCYLQCPYGYVSSSGEAPCTPCTEHTYSLNRTYCAACPAGLSTRGDAQGYPGSCRSACTAGTFSYDGLNPCTACPLGFFQSQAGTSTCVECASDQTTTSRNSTSANNCVPAAPIVCNPNPCFNGTCVAINHDYRCLCQAGYTGRNCQSRIRPCDSSPCFNGAFCVNKDTDYECACTKPSTTGRNCEIDKEDNCATGPCQNLGACQDHVGNHICLCPSFSNYTHTFGLLGSDCTQLRDTCLESPCQNGATCVDFGHIRRKCQCVDGFEGNSCHTDKNYCASNPCQNGAQCQDGPGNQVTCSCLPGYSGALCEVRQDQCDSTVCGQFSTCVDVYTTGRVQCYCNQGFEDVNGVCEVVVTDACLSLPCENNSTCVHSGTGYQCFCLPGYQGANCQHNADDCATNPCLNGGTCQDLLNGFQCICPSDTTAPICQDAFDQCSIGNTPCSRYGTNRCLDYYRGYSCVCLPGYYGVNCTEGQTNCASYPCRHGGTCTDSGSSYFCTCVDGFEGPTCERLRDFCSSGPCANGGTCVNTDTGTVCNCQAGYRGDRCELPYNMCSVANPCTVSGSVCTTDTNNKATCTCPTGYQGPFCQLSTTTCQTTTCLNGATCSDFAGVALCSCPSGFSGTLCEVNNDDCLSSPCPSSSVCVDGVNSYTCVCDQDKIGDGCYKDLSMNFDLIVQPGSTYLNSEPFAWPLASTALTVATWVRFISRTTPGTVLALYGLNSASSVSNPQHLVRIDRQSATLDFSGTKALTLNPAIDDGYWHHVVLTWEGSTGQVTLYVDNAISASTTSYGTGTRLTPYGWVVVGGTYDTVSQSIDRSDGMVGRLSRLHVGTSSMSSSDVSRLYSDTTFVPTGSQRQLTKSLLTGTEAAVDYHSQLTQGECLSATTCRSIDQVSAQPALAQCPDNQMTVSERRSQPSWVTASFLSNDPVSANYATGSTEMGWGYYGVAYTQSDSDGDTAVCSFMLNNRRGTCSNPIPPRFGSQSCVSTSAGIRCEASCNGDYTRSKSEPLFYSCGTYGMFDTADRVLPYSFPSCTSCEKPKIDVVMELNYTMSLSPACNTAQNTLPSNIRSSLTRLNNKWQQGVCGSASCDAVQVLIECPPGLQQHVRATVYLTALDDILRNFDNSVLRSVTEILTIAAADDSSFTYGNAVPDLSSLVITSTNTCPTRTTLLGDCCIACGLGHYYNTDNNACSACPRGSYMDELDQQGTSTTTPCKACPSGMTTPTAAAQSDAECTTLCQFGSYYNMTEALCLPCPVGFYSENPGCYFCDACAILESTAREGATARVSCSVNPLASTTVAPTSPAAPSIGASTQEDELAWTQILLLVLGLILLIILVCLVLFFCFRQHLVRWCPRLVTKIKPEDKTGWHHVDRFGETRIKFASYDLSEVRSRKDKHLLGDWVEEGSVHTNISLQVPVFEEKLNGTVKKKSVHMSDHNAEPKKEKRKKKKRARKTAELDADPEPVTRKPAPLAAAPVTTALPSDGSVRRPPSAFNRPRPTLEELPYDNFVSPRVYENVESVSNPPRSPSTGRRTARIMIESDED